MVVFERRLQPVYIAFGCMMLLMFYQLYLISLKQ